MPLARLPTAALALLLTTHFYRGSRPGFKLLAAALLGSRPAGPSLPSARARLEDVTRPSQ